MATKRAGAPKPPRSRLRFGIVTIVVVALVGFLSALIIRPGDDRKTQIATAVDSRPTVAAVEIPLASVKGVQILDRIHIAPDQVLDPTFTFSTATRSIQIGARIIERPAPRVEWADIERRDAIFLVLPRPVTVPLDTSDIAVAHLTTYINSVGTVSAVVPSGSTPATPLQPYRFALITTDARPMARDIQIGDRFGGPSNLPTEQQALPTPAGPATVQTAVPAGAYPAPPKVAVTPRPSGPYPAKP